MACIRKNESSSESYGFKIVPESKEEITAEWCEKALKIGHYKPIISKDTRIISINVTRLKNEATGVMDGGGFSGSALLRIEVTYGGDVSGDEPASLICKLSTGSDFKWPIFWRAIMYDQMGGGFDERIMKNEAYFMRSVLPELENSGYQHPKIYYVATNNKGERGFIASVVLNSPSKLKSVILMEDMVQYRSSAVELTLSKEDATLCMKNVAILHATFWGDNLNSVKDGLKYSFTEKQYRGATHNKITKAMRRKLISSPEKLMKTINKAISSEWRTSDFMILKEHDAKPDWFRAEPLEDGRYPVFEDPSVKEMLGVLSQRVIEYNRKYLEPFLKKPTQTLLHGDFHGGNHMYGDGENAGKIVALDFQMTGKGLAIFEFFYLILMSLSAHSLTDLIDIAKEYHNVLISHGVEDYSMNDFEKDIEVLSIELCLQYVGMMPSLKPKALEGFLEGWGEKSEDAKHIFGNGMHAKVFMMATSKYLKDKETFMT